MCTQKTLGMPRINTVPDFVLIYIYSLLTEKNVCIFVSFYAERKHPSDQKDLFHSPVSSFFKNVYPLFSAKFYILFLWKNSQRRNPEKQMQVLCPKKLEVAELMINLLFPFLGKRSIAINIRRECDFQNGLLELLLPLRCIYSKISTQIGTQGVRNKY